MPYEKETLEVLKRINTNLEVIAGNLNKIGKCFHEKEKALKVNNRV